MFLSAALSTTAAAAMGDDAATLQKQRRGGGAGARGGARGRENARERKKNRARNARRRRLSVQSDNKFVEGVEKLSLGKGRRTSIAIREGESGSHISRLYGLSKKGYAPYFGRAGRPRRRVAAAPRLGRGLSSETSRGCARIVRGHESRLGRDVDSTWTRVAAAPRVPRG